MSEQKKTFQPPTIDSLKTQLHRPKRAVVTAGMTYANGPIHLGHLAGTIIPADIYARWLRMLIGKDNVLFVNGSDDHGSTSEVAALKGGKPTQSFIGEMHALHRGTVDRYNISVDTYSGTSRDECFPIHKEISQQFLEALNKNGMLNKRTTKQWFDVKLGRFLQDRFVTGKCPNAKCENLSAYSDECEVCGTHYDPSELLQPKSALSGETPVLQDTTHWWLDMWKVDDGLCKWIQSKERTWRSNVYTEVINTVLPALRFDNTHEPKYKELKATLPKHKSKYAAGKKILVQCDSKAELSAAAGILKEAGIPTELADGWAHRSISRDVSWGIPLPESFGPEAKGKTFYVWPDSLVAPIAFTKVALKQKGRDPNESDDFWRDPEARVYQFMGQDNVFFYSVMQGAMWLGARKDVQDLNSMPAKGEYQLTDIFSVFHLMADGEKMSKSRGNFYTGDQLILEKGYTADQIRYFLALLSLPEKPSNFDFNTLNDRNKFLAGPLNAAIEKPISACHSKFDGKVPAGTLNAKVLEETTKMLQRYFKAMERADYANLLFAIENYARLVNSMFTQFKPHDDRAPEEQRRDALFSCFYVLKNMMIMLYPFVPATMDKVRQSLNLPETVFRVEELGVAIPAGHVIGEKLEYFPAVEGAAAI